MKQRKTRCLALLLAVVMVLGLLPGIALPKAEAATPDYAALKTTIQGLKYPLATTLNWPVGNTASVDGIYMVVSSQSRSNTGTNSDKFYTLNPAAPETDGASYVGYAVNKAEADATGCYFTGASRASYSILKGNPTSFTIQSMDMLYWNIEAIGNRTDYAALRLRPGLNDNQFYIGVSSGRYHTIQKKTNNWYLHSNSYTFRASIARYPQNKPDETQLFICKVNDEAFYLRDALQDALVYLVDNSTGRFDAEDYENFLTTVQVASDYYASISRTVWSEINSSVAKSHKNAVYDAMARLRLSDSTQSYIDIPIEILDFRGDGILFESYDPSPYSLGLGGAQSYYPDNYPGWNNGVSAAGLAYDTLVDGHIVHTKATVDYIAEHLYKQTVLDKYPPKQKMNPFFYELIKSGKLTYNANGYWDTIAKCKPAIEGGKLYWGDVKTYHDLAYYMLSHLWRESEDIIGTDTLADGTPYQTTYNMRVNELSKVRLFKDGATYSYKSSELSSYSQDGYILNIMNNALGKPSGDPQFRPIDEKGFESNNLFGSATDNHNANAHNWLFTLHAYGSFIYTEDANLEFNFTGDDDVYFYVNNTLACDIGGMHTSATSGVKLNELVKNGTLSLKDGQICRFDMFYAERHTVGINLNFTTNIQIMDESVITEKTQYDPTTNQPIMDGAAVNTGTEIAYSFGLTNCRTAPVTNLKLTDSKLGVTLDGTEKTITLTDLTIDNIRRSATDLTVVYSGNDFRSEEASSVPAQPLSFEEMEALIREAVGSTDSGAPLGTGVYSYAVESEENLLTLLELGIPASCKLTVKGFRHKVEDGLFTNSLTTQCTPVEYVPNAEGGVTKELGDPISGSASCRCFGMSLDLVSVNDPYAVVLDYGKSVDVDLPPIIDTITTADGVEVSYIGSTFNGAHGTVKTTEPINLIFTKADQMVDMEKVQYTMTSDQRLRFAPKSFMSEVNNFWAVYKVTVPSIPDFEPYYIMKAVSFIPATMVYYEAESFIEEFSYTEKRTTGADTEAPVTTTFEAWGQEGAANGVKEEGTDATDNLQEFKPVGIDHPYGFDPSYGDDSLLSNGKSLYVEGAGVVVPNAITNDNYTQIEFSFVGTGFDIISRTGAQQATIRVSVYDDPGKANDHRIKSITVNNKGELELYQIPVVSVQGLEHGTYYVSLWVNDKITGAGFPQLPGVDLSGLTRGNEFYLDAIRIYDPIDVSGDVLFEDQTIALDAYKADKEAYNYIKEIRNILLSKENFDTLEDTLAGAVFVDMETTPEDIVIQETDSEGETTGETTVVEPEDVEVTEHVTAKVQTYNKVGPKNEVYLAPGQAVAFRLAVDTLQPIVSLDVGAKTIEANSRSKLTVGFVSDTNGVEGKASFHLATATAQYYAIDAENIRSLTADSSKAVYFVIYNDTEGDKGENVISITDIKVAYEGKPTIQPPADSPTDPEIKRGIWEETPPVRFLVDRNAATAAETFLKAILAEPPAEEEPPVEEPPFEEPPIVAEGIRILHSLNLASDISINYAVPKAELAGYENVVMTCTLPVYEGDGLMDLRQLTLLPVEQGDYLYFTLTGMTAVNMNDTVEAVLSMTKEGRDYTTAVDTYSVAQYAYAQLNKAYTDRALKVLCADLLRYGAKAQIIKNYRTDSLADANMTDAHKAYLSDIDSVTFGNTNKILNDLENAPITWTGKALDLESKVALKFVFNPANYNGDPSALTLMISYADINGTPKSLSIKDPELYNPDLGLYVFTLDALLAAELRTVVSVQIFAGDLPVSCTLQYSADTYGNNKTGNLLELCKALFAYSDSAKAYFQ